MPKFSIIIPLYNKANHIKDTLNTVFKQTFTDYEIIIVNDGSTDDSLQVVSDLKDERIKLFNIKNQGVSAARNFAMLQAKGEYFAFLDADDVWLPNHLEELNKLITHYPGCGMYCSNYEFDYGNFKTAPKFPTLPKDKNWNGIIEDYFEASLTNRISWTSAIAIPKSILTTIGGFNTQLTHGEDTEYWSRIALKHKIAFTKKVSAIYKLDGANRACKLELKKRKIMSFDLFLKDEKQNTSLKKFNDGYRYEYALQHKVNGDLKTCTHYLKDINWENISVKKKILIQLPAPILHKLWQLKQWLKSKQIDLYI